MVPCFTLLKRDKEHSKSRQGKSMENELSFLHTSFIKHRTVRHKEESKRIKTNSHCLLHFSECVRSSIASIKVIYLSIFLSTEYICATKAKVRFDHDLLIRKLFSTTRRPYLLLQVYLCSYAMAKKRFNLNCKTYLKVIYET